MYKTTPQNIMYPTIKIIKINKQKKEKKKKKKKIIK